MAKDSFTYFGELPPSDHPWIVASYTREGEGTVIMFKSEGQDGRLIRNGVMTVVPAGADEDELPAEFFG